MVVISLRNSSLLLHSLKHEVISPAARPCVIKLQTLAVMLKSREPEKRLSGKLKVSS